MAKTPKRQLGDMGEGVAAKYYENKGFSVIERNYLKPWGEIDLVVKKGEILVFVEVKTVTREPSGGVTRERYGFRPEDNVHTAKLTRLHRAVQTYLAEKGVPEALEWRIDVACVYLSFTTRKAKVDVLENVIL